MTKGIREELLKGAYNQTLSNLSEITHFNKHDIWDAIEKSASDIGLRLTADEEDDIYYDVLEHYGLI